MESRIHRLSMAELNSAALEHFIYQPVTKPMIRYLARAASNVIACDSSLMPAPVAEAKRYHSSSPAPHAETQTVRADDGGLPSLEDFITQLVVSSNVQVPTLMSTLVYLARLKSRLQPMARGLRCTTHRIFLACLILAAKYLNDSSPKNKHWANYSHIHTSMHSFGFGRTEVNLMEKQLLFLLDWDLRIQEEDLYHQLDAFLAPIRSGIEAKYMRHERLKEELRLKEEMRQRRQSLFALPAAPAATAGPVAAMYPSPPLSRGGSVSNMSSPDQGLAGGVSPPALSYASSASSYASSAASSIRTPSRSTSPSDAGSMDQPYVYLASPGHLCSSPESLSLNPHAMETRSKTGKTRLAYENSPDELRESEGGKAKRPRMGRGMWGRVFGSSVAVR